MDLPKLGPLALLTSVVNGVESQDGEIVPYGELGESHPGCVNEACYAEIAKTTGATHVLRIDATFAKNTFELQLQMWDVASNTIVSGERQQCKLCVANDLLTAAHNQAVVLCTKRFLATSAIPRPTPPLPSSRDPLEKPPGTDLRTLATEGLPTWRRVTPWIGLGVGIPLLVSGIALVAINNNTVCEGGESSPCTHAYDTSSRGWLLIGGGGLMTAGGAALLGFNWWHHGDTAIVSVAPDRIGVSGRF